MRHNHRGLNQALAGLDLCEVSRPNGKAVGYMRRRVAS
jgi:hypothetical protein